ncbi:MAG: Ig-like domain-containing protein [Bacteroidales bacterium]|nr:Ig-like domain-containing protein [Bacteroidales bacterium]
MNRFFAIALAVTVLFTACDKDEVKVTGVSLNKPALVLIEGASETLTAAVTPANADNKNITWKSDKPDIATTDANGKITAVKAGTATVTVTTDDGRLTASCTVTVSEKAVELIVTDNAKYDIPAMVTGAKIADIDLSDAVSGGKAPYTFTAAGLPAGIAVSAAGVISGTPTTVTPDGKAVIIITDSSSPVQSKTITIGYGTVSMADPAFVPVTNITVIPSAATGGTSLTLTGTVVPANATNKAIAWSVKDAGTTGATISGSILSATTAGTATITATVVNGVSAGINYTQDFTITVSVTTSPPPPPPAFVPVTNIAGVPATAKAGTSLTLTGTVAPTHATNKAIAWSVKDAGTTGATISGSTFSATTAGTATVTATIVNGTSISTNYTQDFDITVTGPIASGTAGPLAWSLSADGTLNITGTGAMPDYPVDYAPWYSHRSDIQTVAMGSSVTNIGDRAFYDCTALTAITIPESVTIIRDNAFYGCTTLPKITIPASVESVGNGAFYECSALKNVTCLATMQPTLGANNFTAAADDILYVLSGSVETYRNGAWGSVFSIVAAINGGDNIGYGPGSDDDNWTNP